MTGPHTGPHADLMGVPPTPYTPTEVVRVVSTSWGYEVLCGPTQTGVR
jgi:hypothetical protein